MLELEERMKRYENSFQFYLPQRIPLIIRIDGRAFHTFARKCEKPWDQELSEAFVKTAQKLIEEIQGAKLAYGFSDEISILITDYDRLESQPWFGKNLNKIVSVSASIATAEFNHVYNRSTATFDSRTFIIPKEDVCNYFVWRQQDAIRNSINALGQFHFSHKQLQNLSCGQIKEKLLIEKNIDWNRLDFWKKWGWCVTKETVDNNIPLFTEYRNYIDKFVLIGE